MFRALEKLVLDPYPLRTAYLKAVRRFGWFDYARRVELGAVERPHYATCIYAACRLAEALGYERISVIEFGVAGGNGLVAIERHVNEVERISPVRIEVYGFDTGEGLPEPVDYRDLPYVWQGGFYKMDVPALERRLTRSRLVLGPVAATVPEFAARYAPAPIGAVFFDLDFYSSTVDALRLFAPDGPPSLPRVFSYFDDIRGSDRQLYNDFTGERLAIHDFNAANADRKLSPAYYLLTRKVVEPWYHGMYLLHLFSHPDYGRFVSKGRRQLALEP